MIILISEFLVSYHKEGKGKYSEYNYRKKFIKNDNIYIYYYNVYYDIYDILFLYR